MKARLLKTTLCDFLINIHEQKRNTFIFFGHMTRSRMISMFRQHFELTIHKMKEVGVVWNTAVHIFDYFKNDENGQKIVFRKCSKCLLGHYIIEHLDLICSLEKLSSKKVSLMHLENLEKIGIKIRFLNCALIFMNMQTNYLAYFEMYIFCIYFDTK